MPRNTRAPASATGEGVAQSAEPVIRARTNLRNILAIQHLPVEIQVRLFDFIEVEIPRTRFFFPDKNPNPEWRLYKAKDWSDARAQAVKELPLYYDIYGRGESVMNDLWQVVARVPNGRLGGRQAYRGTAWNHVSSAVHSAVVEAASAAIKHRPQRISRATELVASTILASDQNYEKKAEYEEFARRQWEVWQKGYGLATDLNNVLYVYQGESGAKDFSQPQHKSKFMPVAAGDTVEVLLRKGKVIVLEDVKSIRTIRK